MCPHDTALPKSLQNQSEYRHYRPHFEIIACISRKMLKSIPALLFSFRYLVYSQLKNRMFLENKTMMLHCSSGTLPSHMKVERVDLFNSSGERRRGDLRPGGGGNPVVIVCHSSMAFKDWGFFLILVRS